MMYLYLYLYTGVWGDPTPAGGLSHAQSTTHHHFSSVVQLIGAVQYSAVQYSTVQCSTVQYGALQCSAVELSVLSVA